MKSVLTRAQGAVEGRVIMAIYRTSRLAGALRVMVVVMKALTFTLLLVLAPMSASAVTLQQVVALSKAGVSEPVILALIDRDKTIFTIDPEDLVALKVDGVSEKIVLAMLKSGREEAAAADRADEEQRRAEYMAAVAAGPQSIVIGHEPERPGYSDNAYAAAPPAAFSSDFNPVPYAVPYAVPYVVSPQPMRYRNRRVVAPQTTHQLCLAQVTAGHALPSIGFVTVCPSR
jgi:hypothetical protein